MFKLHLFLTSFSLCPIDLFSFKSKSNDELMSSELVTLHVTSYLTCYLVGQPIDGPENGPAPHAWQVQVTQPAAFQPTVIFKEIPHTATVKVKDIMGEPEKYINCFQIASEKQFSQFVKCLVPAIIHAFKFERVS